MAPSARNVCIYTWLLITRSFMPSQSAGLFTGVQLVDDVAAADQPVADELETGGFAHLGMSCPERSGQPRVCNRSADGTIYGSVNASRGLHQVRVPRRNRHGNAASRPAPTTASRGWLPSCKAG